LIAATTNSAQYRAAMGWGRSGKKAEFAMTRMVRKRVLRPRAALIGPTSVREDEQGGQRRHAAHGRRNPTPTLD
jgi:hypothetical protein